MFKHILVPMDFSPIGDEALRVARVNFPEVPRTLLHVIQPSRVSQVAEREHARLDGLAIRKRLEYEAAQDLKRLVQDGERLEVAVGEPAEQILVLARKIHVDLIVIGTHSRTGLRLFLSGSVTTEVVRHARLPVLVVHEGDTQRT
jgi:nucleotide-binding universal stress UspA family protein